MPFPRSKTSSQSSTSTAIHHSLHTSPRSLHSTPAGSDLDSVNPLHEHEAPSSSLLRRTTLSGALPSTAEEPQLVSSPTSSFQLSPPATPSQCTMQTSPSLPSPSYPRQPSSSKMASKTSSFFRLPSRSPSNSSKPTPSSPSAAAPLPPTNLAIVARVPTSRTTSLASRPSSSRRTISEPQDVAAAARPGYIRKRNSYGAGVNHCGRHSNDWLFGGMSIRETFKGIVWRDPEDSDH